MDSSDWKEFQSWGMNPLTIGFIGNILFTALLVVGSVRQNQKIWKSKSGESVSLSLYNFLIPLYIVMTIYGYREGMFAIFICGLIKGIVAFPILVGLWKYTQDVEGERKMTVLYLSVILYCPFAERLTLQAFYLALVVALILFVGDHTRQVHFGVKDKGHVGQNSIILQLCYFLNSLFWLIYGLAVPEPVLIVTTPFFLAFTGYTIWLCINYPFQDVQAQPPPLEMT